MILSGNVGPMKTFVSLRLRRRDRVRVEHLAREQRRDRVPLAHFGERAADGDQRLVAEVDRLALDVRVVDARAPIDASRGG